MPDELKEAIEKNVQGPKSAKGDEGEARVEQQPLKDQNESDRYLSSREAPSKPYKGAPVRKAMAAGGLRAAPEAEAMPRPISYVRLPPRRKANQRLRGSLFAGPGLLVRMGLRPCRRPDSRAGVLGQKDGLPASSVQAL